MEWTTSGSGYNNEQNSSRTKNPILQYGQMSKAMAQYQVNGDPNHPDVYCKSVDKVASKLSRVKITK